MTHSKQASKRVRQNENRRQRNKAESSAIKTLIKRVLEAAAKGDKKEALAALPMAMSRIDKAARGAMHRNTAARRKSRLMQAIAKIDAKGTGDAAPAKKTGRAKASAKTDAKS